MNLLCRLGFHKWKEGTEGYKMGDVTTGREKIRIKTRRCTHCYKAQVYTLLKEFKQDPKFWKTWDKNEGETITWDDLG